MVRFVIIALLMLLSVTKISAQNDKLLSQGIVRYDLAKSSSSPNPSDEDSSPFILPKDSFLKLQRQLDLKMLPAGFFPALETEGDPFKRKALRYGIAYYRDSEVPGLAGFQDVVVPVRFDTRNGQLEIRYFRTALIIISQKVQIPEDRPAMAILSNGNMATMMLFLFEGNRQELVSFEGLFADDPHPTNFIGADDVVAVNADEGTQRFAAFFRGGATRNSLFLLLTDPTLNDIQTSELIHDLPSTDQAFVFQIIPSLSATFRGINLNVK